ncbi:NTE family protein rssA [uncultured Roseburia sp.]|uniref:Patatin family protein n=1 Tax=Brotonthovivens ammoniilytica TaxID=2981725 RepID=A0ABT2TKI7_9FIRM|nr:patatin family protein [Brotonthovivens ammoniilytica]MCU6762705.1 patatin family protein [Brotonthovivens ammoniilytica]SCI85474.1 NTE family protein rssA [uncultured Roseburia sp.]
MKKYSGIDELPFGQAEGDIIKGCLVLEGGAFRGLYTGGVLDALMVHGIQLECVAGVSAGALNGYNYISGQIGRASRFNLGHRHDPDYVGLPAFRRNHGLFGFDIVFDDERNGEPLNKEKFMDPGRRFIAVATDCRTGKPVYFENGKCGDIFAAIQASASMPVISKMVEADGIPCLDGGCSVAIPLDFAIGEGYEKIIVVKTRDDLYRKNVKTGSFDKLKKLLYRKYPELLKALFSSASRYNELCERIQKLRAEGRIYVISPSSPVTVSRLERDMEKLGALYHQGYNDTVGQLEKIREYLAG